MPDVDSWTPLDNTTGPTRLRAVLMRSGTSKGLFLRRSDLPLNLEEWHRYILPAMGSPDSYGRQLDGVGGGSSTTSKVAVVGRCDDAAVADIDYTFVQVPVNGTALDFSGNCGNMAAGCGPFAVVERLVNATIIAPKTSMTVRIRNTNTGSIINSTFEVRDGYPVEAGSMAISGVSGTGSPIRLAFVEPAGAVTNRLLPSGCSLDVLHIVPANNRPALDVSVSMVDAANPFVFVLASSLGLSGNETPSELAPFTPLIQEIRAAASIKMGLATTMEAARKRQGVPKIALLAGPSTYKSLSGTVVEPEEMDIQVRSYSNGLPHPALQMTGAVCVAAACSIPGSIAERLLRGRKGKGPLRFAQPSGVTTADHEVVVDEAGEVHIKSATVYRTARRLFEGSVLVNL